MCMYGIVSCAAIVQSNSCLFLLHYHRHLRADVGSDHQLLKSKIKIKLKKLQERVINSDNLKDEGKRQQFLLELKHRY